MKHDGLKERTVLIVEDHSATRDALAHSLKKFGCTIQTAADGAEGLAMYDYERPDIIISDIEMPEIKGIELARRIRKEDERTRIILITAFCDEQKLLQAIELGLTSFLRKPVQNEELKEALLKAALQLAKFDGHDAGPVVLGEGVVFDAAKMALIAHETEVALNRSESKLIEMLARPPGRVISAEQIVEEFWHERGGKTLSQGTLKNIVMRLRDKLGEEAIQSVYGVGYRFEPAYLKV